MKFQIDRSKWLRGEGADRSRLLRTDDGKMCCLGQYCLARGLLENSIQSKRSPMSVKGAPPELTSFSDDGELRNSRTACALMVENDGLANEAEIIHLFAKIEVDGQPVEVEFVN